MPTEKQTSRNLKLEEYLVTGLREMYWSEIQLVTVLNTMTEISTAEDLRDAFQTHREQTEVHAQRLEQIFSLLDRPAQTELCQGLQGIFNEGWKVIDESEPGSAQRDAALIIAAQKVEHYEMACYGSMVALARTLGLSKIADILSATLQEEKDTDQLLTSVAEAGVNEEAGQEPATM